jgi:hypothetical protein
MTPRPGASSRHCRSIQAPDRSLRDATDDICRAGGQTAIPHARPREYATPAWHIRNRSARIDIAARAAGSGSSGRSGAVRLRCVPCSDVLEPGADFAGCVVYPGPGFTTQPDDNLEARQPGQQHPEPATNTALEAVSIDSPAQGLAADDESEQAYRRARVVSDMDRAVGSGPSVSTGQDAPELMFPEQTVRSSQHRNPSHPLNLHVRRFAERRLAACA